MVVVCKAAAMFYIKVEVWDIAGKGHTEDCGFSWIMLYFLRKYG